MPADIITLVDILYIIISLVNKYYISFKLESVLSGSILCLSKIFSFVYN